MTIAEIREWLDAASIRECTPERWQQAKMAIASLLARIEERDDLLDELKPHLPVAIDAVDEKAYGKRHSAKRFRAESPTKEFGEAFARQCEGDAELLEAARAALETLQEKL